MEHSKEFEALAADARGRIKEVTVAQTLERLEHGAKLIDVREDDEWFTHASDAIHMSRGIIERDIVQAFPDKAAEMILYCGGGYRSSLAADNLQKMGYTNVYSMAGGWTAWNEAGAPTEMEIPF